MELSLVICVLTLCPYTIHRERAVFYLFKVVPVFSPILQYYSNKGTVIILEFISKTNSTAKLILQWLHLRSKHLDRLFCMFIIEQKSANHLAA